MKTSKFSKSDNEEDSDYLEKVNELISQMDEVKNLKRLNRKLQEQEQKERLLGILDDT
jgi:hypothetical protein